jgi:polygalacturonase
MERLCRIVFALAALFVTAVPGRATVLLDQTAWTTGTRTSQSLPTRSGWFCSGSGSLSVSGGFMLMKVLGSSGAAITYFTTSNSPPVQLNVGDTLTATIKFNFVGVPTTSSSSQGFKLGVFDFADGSNVPLRVTADGSPFSSGGEGLSVEGYSLFEKMYTSFADDQPIDIRKRTAITDGSLLGASADWTSLAKGGDTNVFTGFASNTLYTIQIAMYRSNLTTMAIAETWSNLVNGATLSFSAVDDTATNFNFDGIEFRPASNSQAPATNSFREVKVEVTSAPVAPSILTPPQDLSVPSGQSPVFSAVVSGTLPLYYQWYRDTNTLVSSSTINFPAAHTPTAQPMVTLTNAQPEDAGGYTVIVSNSYGSVTSAVANLTVTLAAPTITSQPQDLTVIPTQPATFSVTVIGSEPFSYQWYYNTNTLLVGATDSTLTLTNPQAGDAGIYSVIVSNPVDTATSSNAVLTVNTNPVAPIFVTQPASISVSVGDDASFAAAAIGTQPISYQWNTNGVPLPGATASTLSLGSVQPVQAGNYTVIASNSIGTTVSSTAVLSVSVRMTPPLPVIPATNFFVTDFGAVGNGVLNNATAFTNAINAAVAAGGGSVIVTGGTYLCGPIVLFNNINLQVNSDATLKMLPRANWPSTLPPFISGSGVHDVSVTGAGTIDGNAGFGSPGAGNTNWWPFLDTAHRPDFIHFDNASARVLIQGVTLQKTPAFHLMLKGNNVSVTIQNITINTDPNSPNTDGMDLASTNVLVQNCFISDGDDNIEIGGSGGPAADITVSNCTFGPGHGVSIGSKIQGGVHDLLVSNCTFNGGDYGIRMKSDRDIGGVAQNLKYFDLTMTDVGYPIAIYGHYDTIGTPNSISPAQAAADYVQAVVTTTPVWRNITIANLTATANSGANISAIIWGLPEMLASNITLKNVNLSSPGQTFEIYNAQGVRIIDSLLTSDGSANSLTLYNAQITVTNTTASTNLVTLGGLAKAGTNNTMSFINSLAAITDTNMLGTGPITLGGSTLTVKQGSVNSSNNPITIIAASTLAFTSGSNALNGALSGSGGPLTLNLPGSSVLTLRGDSSGFGGALVVSNSGTLLVNNPTGSGTGTGAVTVLSAARLGGSGVLGGPVTVNGTLAPGNSPGTLTISNDVTVSGGAVVQYELGTASDLTVVSGNLTLGGTLNVTDAGGFTNATYTLFTYGGALNNTGLTVGMIPSTNFNYTIDTGTAGQVNLVVSNPTPPPPVDPFVAWQLLYFGCTNLVTCPQAAGDADFDGDGISNTNEFLAGTNPTNSASGLRIISTVRRTTDVVITWTTAGGFTNTIQATSGNGNGGYTNNFADISGPISIQGSGDTTTNYVDGGGATNSPSRYYRVRLVP